MIKKLVVGILAHVDAGKTTLSEGLLYLSGKIRKLGRVDNRDAYLDTNVLERARGITIFSKQALFAFQDTQITLLDTPGHVDFSAEMERTLQVLDYAILVISGADGVQGHTKTLWRLLERYKIPTFIFVNKMDQGGTDSIQLMNEIKEQLIDDCIDFQDKDMELFYDQLAMSDEKLMEAYLEEGQISIELIQEAITARKVFPCYFGSALKLVGIEEFMSGFQCYTKMPSYGDEFGAKVFKITRDEQGNRLTHMKLTGGSLSVRAQLSNGKWEEKVNQIRIYSGDKFEAVNEVSAGTICAVVGLSQTRALEGLGRETGGDIPILAPVLSYQMILPDGYDPRMILPKLRMLEEEEPALHIIWDEELQEIQVQMMGEVQIEILGSIIETRLGITVQFDTGRIVYKETIENEVEGVGHFEPLRHYAEVHLLLTKGERGSGLKFKTTCSEDMLGKNWQRLVLSHLEERSHRGVLTGSPITDMTITLVAGRAHNKHTEGGDFREATYRAVRQGLKEAKSILLEPYYTFRLELPENLVGRAMMDVEKMHGTCEISQTNGTFAVLIGTAPVVTMRNYQKEVVAYTKGYGRISYSLKGYEPCHNTDDIISNIGYDSERDVGNPTGSVFCAHGSGFLVPWNEVKKHMHIEAYLKQSDTPVAKPVMKQSIYQEEQFIDLDEIDRIISRTSYANQGKKSDWKKHKTAKAHYYTPKTYNLLPKETKDEYLLVDGYNIIFAWPELKDLAQENMDGAKVNLLDILSNYQGIRQCHIIVVFDAYRVQGHIEETIKYHNIHMVYTKEAQTADQYIEQFAHQNQKKYHITVATSDGLQQIIIRGAGCDLLSATELKTEIDGANDKIKTYYKNPREDKGNNLMQALSSKDQEALYHTLEEE